MADMLARCNNRITPLVHPCCGADRRLVCRIPRLGDRSVALALALLGCLHILAHIQTQQHRTLAELTSLREQLGARTERLERLQALTTAMLATLDDRRQFHILCERLAALLDAEAGWITLYDQDGLCVPTVHGLTVRHTESAQVDRARYDEIIQRGQIVLIADERVQQLVPAINSDDPIRWSMLLVIPLTTDRGAIGAICLAFEHLRGLERSPDSYLFRPSGSGGYREHAPLERVAPETGGTDPVVKTGCSWNIRRWYRA